MTMPWLLVAATGVTVGALFGWVGVALFAPLMALTSLLARQRWLAVMLVALVASLIGVARTGSMASPGVDTAVVTSTAAEGAITGMPRVGPAGPRAVVRVDRVLDDRERWRAAKGDVLVFLRDSTPNGIGRGDRIRMRWSVEAGAQFDRDFRQFVESEGAGAVAWSFHTTVLERGNGNVNVLVRLRNLVTGRIERAISGDAGALLAGFVTGDDSGISEEARQAFQVTNTSHITAVSGSNVAILITMWLVVVPTRRMQRRLLVQIALLALIWFYVGLVGLQAPAVRAGLFASLMLPAFRFGRKADPMTSLMLASAIMVLVKPAFALNVGFWLSLAASVAILTTIPVSYAAPARFFKRGVLALLAAQVATFPLVLWVFGGWSPVSLVANLVIGPLVSVLFPPAFVFAVIVTCFPWLGGLLGWLPALGADAIIAVVQSLAGAFPMLRTGPATAGSLGLLTVFTGAMLAGISLDARRWAVRAGAANTGAKTPAIVLGGSFGLWLAVMILVAI